MNLYTMPPEWAPHDRCWMGWPCAEYLWGDTIAAVRDEFAEVAKAIARFEPVTMLYDPRNAAGIEVLHGVADISFVECPMNDTWLRDTGPTFVVSGPGELAGIDWTFDGWGADWPTDKDALIAERVIGFAGAKRVISPLVFEGGSLNVDDRGTGMTTRQCFAHRTRNGGPGADEFEHDLCAQLGLKKLIWLEETLENDSTNGHVDVVATFAPGGRAICQISNDLTDPDYDNMLRNKAILEGSTDGNGDPIQVHTLTAPPVSRFPDGSRRMLSYINFYIANGGLIVPQYGFEDHDAAACETLARLFPDHEVVGVTTNMIADGGGNIHCITQQQPKTGA